MGPARKRVLAVVPVSPDSKTIFEVATETRLSYSSARTHLKALERDDKVLRARDGRVDIYCRIDGETSDG